MMIKATKINVDEKRKLWIVSDLHLFHKRLCKGYPNHFEETRLYETVEEMNNDIVNRWNKTVQPEDQVIMLGDWFLNVPYSQLATEFKKYTEILNGEFIAICFGNHDFHLRSRVKDVNFYNKICFDYRGRHFICQHHDFNEFKLEESEVKDIDKLVLVHGHTHRVEKLSECDFGKMNNVCWETRYDLADATELCSTNEEYVDIDIPESDLAIIQKKAESVGLSVSEYVKDALVEFMENASDEDFEKIAKKIKGEE